MKFRKKPVVIEAIQFTGDNIREILDFAHKGLPAQANSIIIPTTDRYFYVRTLEGEMTAVKGDWIIRGIKNEYYPVKNEIFEATYEPVEPRLMEECTEPHQRPPSNHLEVNYIAVGYYKHEIDFGVLGSVQELSEDDFNKMLHMLNTAIEVAKDMRKRNVMAQGWYPK